MARDFASTVAALIYILASDLLVVWFLPFHAGAKLEFFKERYRCEERMPDQDEDACPAAPRQEIPQETRLVRERQERPVKVCDRSKHRQ